MAGPGKCSVGTVLQHAWVPTAQGGASHSTSSASLENLRVLPKPRVVLFADQNMWVFQPKNGTNSP